MTEQAADIVSTLRTQIERYHQRQAQRAGWTRRHISTGLEPLDAALPHGGVPRGVIVGVLSHVPGVGALSLAMRITRECVRDRDEQTNHIPRSTAAFPRTQSADWPFVFVDTREDFYPPAVGTHGLSLERLIVIRTGHRQNALWAVEQSLRCPVIGAVIAPLTGLTERDSRRLQLAAECTGCVGLVLRSARERGKSFAAVRLLVEGVASDDNRHLCDIHILTVRGGSPAGPFRVDLNAVTSNPGPNPPRRLVVRVLGF